MNRRLFVRQIVAGASLVSVPASLLAQPTHQFTASSPIDSLRHYTGKQRQFGALGTLQHITLSHVYSPGYTSPAVLTALAQQDISRINALFGTGFCLGKQPFAALVSADYGSYATTIEQDGLKITWQALARIGSETRKPVARLRVYGSNGVLHDGPDNSSYTLVDLQGRANQLSS